MTFSSTARLRPGASVANIVITFRPLATLWGDYRLINLSNVPDEIELGDPVFGSGQNANLEIVLDPQATGALVTQTGTELRRVMAQRPPLDCEPTIIEYEWSCNNGFPQLRVPPFVEHAVRVTSLSVRIPETGVVLPGTKPNPDSNEYFWIFDPPPPGRVIFVAETIPADPTPDQLVLPTGDIEAPTCQVAFSIICQDGQPVPLFTPDLGSTPAGGEGTLTPAEPDWLAGVVVAARPDNGVAAVPNTATVPDCQTNVSLRCVQGQATVRIQALSPAPSPAQVFTIDGGQAVAAGDHPVGNEQDVTVAALNGIQVQPPAGDRSATVTLPGVDCEVEVSVACVAGQAVLTLDRGASLLVLVTVDGVELDGAPYQASVNSPSASIVITNVDENDDGVTPSDLRLVDPDNSPSRLTFDEQFYAAELSGVPTCVIPVSAACQAGNAVLVADVSGAPPGTTIVPTPGTPVAENTTVQVTVTPSNGWRASPQSVVTPDCKVTAQLLCQVSNGLPTGRAELRITTPGAGDLPAGTQTSPPSGTAVTSPGSLTVSVNSGVVFTNNSASTVTLAAPTCAIDVTAVARCVNGGIEVTVTTTGASASSVSVEGVSKPATGTTTVFAGLALRDTYTVAVTAADPTNVLVRNTKAISISEPCVIDLVVTAECADSQVLVTVGFDPDTTTGTVESLVVNGDSTLPYLIAPGAAVNIVVTSLDTRPGDIHIPDVEAPATCRRDDSRPLAATLRVTYSLACINPTTVGVAVTTEGSAGVIALSVNGDSAAPYTVTPGSAIVLSVLTFNANDFVQISGPNPAPVCPTVVTPTPTPTPTRPPVVTPVPTPVVLRFTPDPVRRRHRNDGRTDARSDDDRDTRTHPSPLSRRPNPLPSRHPKPLLSRPPSRQRRPR